MRNSLKYKFPCTLKKNYSTEQKILTWSNGTIHIFRKTKFKKKKKKIEVTILLSVHLFQEDYFPKSFALFLEKFVHLPAEIAAVVDRM